MNFQNYFIKPTFQQYFLICFFALLILLETLNLHLLMNYAEYFFIIIALIIFYFLLIGLNSLEKKKLILSMLGFNIVLLLSIFFAKINGNIFGEFVYLDRSKITFFEVPLFIVLNYTLILFASFYVVSNFLKNAWSNILGGGILTFFFNFTFEAIVEKYDWYVWTDYFRMNWGGIPLQNYLAWFIIGLISSIGIYYLKIKLEPKILITLWFAEIFTFQILLLI